MNRVQTECARCVLAVWSLCTLCVLAVPVCVGCNFFSVAREYACSWWTCMADGVNSQLLHRLVNSGEWDRIRAVLSSRLNESGWTDQLRHRAKGTSTSTTRWAVLIDPQNTLDTCILFHSTSCSQNSPLRHRVRPQNVIWYGHGY